MRALIGHVSRVEIADGLRCAIDGDTVRVTHGTTPDDAATQRAAGFAAQLGTAERALATAIRERDAARDESRARAVAIGALAAGRPVEWAALDGRLDGCAIDALRRIAARVDPQPAGGAVGVGAGVDVAAVVAAVEDAMAHADFVATHTQNAAISIAARSIASRLRSTIAPFASQPDRGADEGDEAGERGAEVVRVVVGEGRLATCGQTGPLYVGQRIGVYGGDLSGLEGREGQQARLVVEIGHVHSVSPAVGGEKSE